jgi:hypothetical protein
MLWRGLFYWRGIMSGPPQPHIEIDVCTLLFGGCDADGRPLGDPMLARRHLLRLGLGRSSADFLARAIWWWFRAGRRDFYKFNIPCAHPNYREGDSWCEELGFCWQTLRQARAAVATKIGRGDSKKEILRSKQLASLLLYWTRADNSTWYELNEFLLCDLLSQALEVRVVMPAPGPRPPHTHTRPAPSHAPARGGATAILDHPQPGNAYAPQSRSYPQNHHPIGDDTRVTSDEERCLGDTPYSSIQQIKEEENKDGEFVRLISRGLEGEGVFPEPALTIARKAYHEGMDLDATLELFWAHKAHAASSKRVRDPIAAATQRLLRGELKPPYASKSSPAAAEFKAIMNGAGQEDARPPSFASESLDEPAASTTPPPPIFSPSLPEDEPGHMKVDTCGKNPAPPWWEPARQHLRGQMTQATYDFLLASCEVWEDDDGTLLVLARDDGAAAHLQRWERRIREAIHIAGGGERALFVASR